MVRCGAVCAGTQADVNLKFDPLLFFANCCVALALNLAVFMLIGKTSALTMNVAGVVRAAACLPPQAAPNGGPVRQSSQVGSSPEKSSWEGPRRPANGKVAESAVSHQ